MEIDPLLDPVAPDVDAAMELAWLAHGADTMADKESFLLGYVSGLRSMLATLIEAAARKAAQQDDNA